MLTTKIVNKTQISLSINQLLPANAWKYAKMLPFPCEDKVNDEELKCETSRLLYLWCFECAPLTSILHVQIYQNFVSDF